MDSLFEVFLLFVYNNYISKLIDDNNGTENISYTYARLVRF